jgi:hypothetical protein
MKYLGCGVALVVIILGTILNLSQHCLADSVSYTVTATVPSVATIVTDNRGNISEILSNSSNPKNIEVRVGSLKGQAANFSSAIEKQYNLITKNGQTVHQGVVYIANKTSTTNSGHLASDFYLFRVFNQISIIRNSTIRA